MAVIRHVLETLLNPYFLCLLLFALCLLLLWHCGNKRRIRWGFTGVLLLFLIFSTGWLPRALTLQLEERYPAIVQANPSIHWVVVFSGGSAEVKNKPVNSMLNCASIKRLLEGVRLYRQLPQAKLLLSGGGYGFDVPESRRLAEIASWFSIPAQNIRLETKSINTADEAKEIKAIVRNEPFYLVTSAIHMKRSLALCQAQGLNPIPAPTDYSFFWNDERWAKMVVPNPYNLYYLSIAMHEVLGELWMKLHHNYRTAS
ncbi:YdcF family protein [Legionella jordanis]|uniref:Membrane protein n=1 Tax=Legionella jordanis TaxID=456 RepID=A0A0W0V954_9GAMM|nr:YdcF family protein [Legionella jordanis]KTD16616.1 membrane protein [Legionella jordanis]RMX03846.1 YdcF family protein [Legionella jordanis]RMX22091.1 YdcF family protein [Legionella jordanis]VEH11920.1 membrane protein [Legionella jordanis]HAT8712776.1 hypothetical protein [Legionella jordanis]